MNTYHYYYFTARGKKRQEMARTAWAALKVPEGKFADIEPLFNDFDEDDLCNICQGLVEEVSPALLRFRAIVFYKRFIVPYKEQRKRLMPGV